MCLSASAPEVNKALGKALIGLRDGEETVSEPDLESTASCSHL